jgi:hypothetical protein
LSVGAYANSAVLSAHRPRGGAYYAILCSRPQTFHKLPALSKHLRDATPPKLAMWLIETARLCQRPLAAIAESGSVCAPGPAKKHTPALGEPQAESLPGGEIHTSFS